MMMEEKKKRERERKIADRREIVIFIIRANFFDVQKKREETVWDYYEEGGRLEKSF